MPKRMDFPQKVNSEWNHFLWWSFGAYNGMKALCWLWVWRICCRCLVVRYHSAPSEAQPELLWQQRDLHSIKQQDLMLWLSLVYIWASAISESSTELHIWVSCGGFISAESAQIQIKKQVSGGLFSNGVSFTSQYFNFYKFQTCRSYEIDEWYSRTVSYVLYVMQSN